MPKYNFRKMFFICENKRVIQPNVLMTNAYQLKKTADNVCETRNLQQGGEHKLWQDKSKPVPVHTVEGFYLVPEALYEEVLRKWVEG